MNFGTHPTGRASTQCSPRIRRRQLSTKATPSPSRERSTPTPAERGHRRCRLLLRRRSRPRRQRARPEPSITTFPQTLLRFKRSGRSATSQHGHPASTSSSAREQAYWDGAAWQGGVAPQPTHAQKRHCWRTWHLRARRSNSANDQGRARRHQRRRGVDEPGRLRHGRGNGLLLGRSSLGCGARACARRSGKRRNARNARHVHASGQRSSPDACRAHC